jgi:hypothetical protein
LNCYSVVSLKQQSAVGHDTPFGNILLISGQAFFALTINDVYLLEKQKIPIYIATKSPVFDGVRAARF